MIRSVLPGFLLCTTLALLLPLQNAGVQSYPNQPVKLVVPFPAGSATDNIARIVGKEPQDDLGQPFVIDNRPGAQGIVGSEFVAKSAPDGYTILFALMVKADFPVRTIREFIDYTRARPGKLSAGHVSSSSQVCIAQLATLANFDAWIATLGPKGLPEPVTRKPHEATLRAMARPDVQAKLATLRFTPAMLGPADAAPFIKAEVVKWAELAKQAGIVPK